MDKFGTGKLKFTIEIPGWSFKCLFECITLLIRECSNLLITTEGTYCTCAKPICVVQCPGGFALWGNLAETLKDSTTPS